MISSAVLGYSKLAAQSNGRLVLFPDEKRIKKSLVDGLDQSNAFHRLGTGSDRYSLPQELGFGIATWAKRFTQQPTTSFLSTGDIFGDDLQIPKRSTSEKLFYKKVLNQMSETYHMYWRQAQAEELEDHQRMIAFYEGMFPSYVISVPRLGAIRWTDTEESFQDTSLRVISSRDTRQRSEGRNTSTPHSRPLASQASQEDNDSSSVRYIQSAQPRRHRSPTSSIQGEKKATAPTGPPGRRADSVSSIDTIRHCRHLIKLTAHL